MINAEQQQLFDEAVTRYGPRCFWNLPVKPSEAGLAAIAQRLRMTGDMAAWNLAGRIKASFGSTGPDLFPWPEIADPDVKPGPIHFFPASNSNGLPHMADIAVSLALTTAGRRQVRDYVDLTLIHEHIMPLWHVLWAAPGKDSQWSPLSLAEKIARTNQFAQAEIDEEVWSLVDLSAPSIGVTIRNAVEEARQAFERLPPETAGCLFVDEHGDPARSVDEVLSSDSPYRPIAPQHGGTWPSGPDIDRAMITRIIERWP